MFTVRFILFGIVLAQLVDAFTFTIGVSRFGIGLESNRSGDLPRVWPRRGPDRETAVLLATIALLVATSSRYPRLLVWGGAAATSLGLLGFAANTASILLLS